MPNNITVVVPTILVLFCFMLPGPGSAQMDVLHSADVPVYPGAYNLSRSFDPAGETMIVTYEIGLAYPAKALLEHYDVQLNARGWQSCLDT